MSATQNRLATGKKVNSALDNPGNFFTSQSLSNRASDLNSLLDSIGQAQQTLKAADQGITSLTKLVESAKSIAKQARQAPQPFDRVISAISVTGTTRRRNRWLRMTAPPSRGAATATTIRSTSTSTARRHTVDYTLGRCGHRCRNPGRPAGRRSTPNARPGRGDTGR